MEGARSRSRGRHERRRRSRGRSLQGERQAEALERKGSIPGFAEFLEDRTFTFLHHYSGPNDPLGLALQEEAAAKGISVKVHSVDFEVDGTDLLRKEPYESHLRRALQGGYDGFHTGWPCTSFSRLRWRKRTGYPGPVRSRRAPYGMKDNTREQQEEADRGTLHASRAAHLVKAVLEGRQGAKVPPVATMENPPPSDHPDHLSAWEMNEVASVVLAKDLEIVDFDTCCYQQDLPAARRHLKPQRFAGSLQDLIKLRKGCSCGEKHDPVVGKEKSRASAEYPWDLCQGYATLAVNQFIRMAKAEYLEMKSNLLKKEVAELARGTEELREAGRQSTKAKSQAKARGQERPKGPHMWWRLDNRAKQGRSRSRPVGDSSEAEQQQVGRTQQQEDLVWTPGAGTHGMLRGGNHKPESRSLGGLQNRAEVVKGMPTAQSLGLKILGEA